MFSTLFANDYELWYVLYVQIDLNKIAYPVTSLLFTLLIIINCLLHPLSIPVKYLQYIVLNDGLTPKTTFEFCLILVDSFSCFVSWSILVRHAHLHILQAVMSLFLTQHS